MFRSVLDVFFLKKFWGHLVLPQDTLVGMPSTLGRRSADSGGNYWRLQTRPPGGLAEDLGI